MKVDSKKPRLIAELLGLYVLLPSVLILFRNPLRGWFIPILLVISGLASRHLRRDPTFDQSEWLKHTKNDGLWIRLTVGVLLLTATLATTIPGLLFELPRTRPLIWLAVCLLYPLISVYPQEVLYRAFFYHRYRTLFTNDEVRIWTNALLFGYVHLMFGNNLALMLSVAAGWVFARTYLRTRSLLSVSIEHALWGILIFTIGFSRFFLGATIPLP